MLRPALVCPAKLLRPRVSSCMAPVSPAINQKDRVGHLVATPAGTEPSGSHRRPFCNLPSPVRPTSGYLDPMPAPRSAGLPHRAAATPCTNPSGAAPPPPRLGTPPPTRPRPASPVLERAQRLRSGIRGDEAGGAGQAPALQGREPGPASTLAMESGPWSTVAPDVGAHLLL